MEAESKKRGAPGLTRRQFAAAVGVMAAAPLADAIGGEPPAAPLSSETLRATAESLAQAVRLGHGKNLTKAQMKQVTISILQGLRSAQRMRKFKLTNADEPAFIFSADLP